MADRSLRAPGRVLWESALRLQLRLVRSRLRAATIPSTGLEWQLVTMLYNQGATILAGGAALGSVAFLAWLRTAKQSFLWLMALTALVVVARLMLEAAFVARSKRADAACWQRRFTAGAWLMAILWGCAALSVSIKDDPVIALLVVASVLVIMVGGAARNAVCPIVARGQVVIGVTPMLVASLLSAEPIFHIMVIVFYAAAAFVLVHELNVGIVRLLSLNARNALLVAEVRATAAELAAANRRLEEAATTDALTGIANRRRFDSVLLDEIARAQRDFTDVSLLLLDIDTFKGFNDRFGHLAGDECLVRVAQTFAHALRRPADLVARFGGEEFVAVLPQTNALAAAALAEGVRATIEGLRIPNPAADRGVVTASIGVASLSRGCRWPAELVAAADRALYAAKAGGRNCVRIAPAQQLDPRRPDFFAAEVIELP